MFVRMGRFLINAKEVRKFRIDQGDRIWIEYLDGKNEYIQFDTEEDADMAYEDISRQLIGYPPSAFDEDIDGPCAEFFNY